MTEKKSQKVIITNSKPLQDIKSIQQSLLIMKRKLSQMNKRQNENIQEIQKVFYSSIPILNKKLQQSIQQQKFQQKKRVNLKNSIILRQKQQKNKQTKMINQKQIQRNRQMISMMKINQRNMIKQLSRKNQQLIQRMKHQHLQQNRQKRQLVKSRMQHSRMKVNDFRINKLQEIKKQKQQDSLILEKKKQRMLRQINYLLDKQNVIVESVDKSEQMLRQLRFAIDKMQKMTEIQFIKIRNIVKQQSPGLNQQRLFQKILVKIIQIEKIKATSLSTATTTTNKFFTKSLYQSPNKYPSTGHLTKLI